MPLMDISGIGSKTAEKLRRQGINDKGELRRAFRRNDPAVVDTLNKRALDGIRQDLFERGERFTDPQMGIEVGPDQQRATEKLGLTTLGDLPSVDVTQAKAGSDAEFTADTTLGELAPQAASGELGERDAPRSVIGWASDAAANLGIGGLGSGQMQDVNQIKKEADPAETTAPSVAKRSSPFPEYAEEQFELSPGGTAKAQAQHEERSAKAQRVDERREATVTDDYKEWSEAPDRYDYPGVDTPDPLDPFFAEGRTSSGFGLGTSTVRNRGDQGLRRGLERIQQADPEVQERAIGEPVDFSIGELFESR